MSRETIRVIARLQAKPGKADELLENDAEPAELTFVEEWQSEHALQAHLATAHVQYALSRCPDLLVGNLDLRRYKLVG